MRSIFVLIVAAFVGAVALSLYAANTVVTLVEEQSEIELRMAFDRGGLSWAEVEARGLTVTLSGTAPSEALRFRALSVAGSVVDAARLIDEMAVRPARDIAPPRFSVEMLRNASGVSIIGLVPKSTNRRQLIAQTSALLDTSVTDLLETADFAAPDGWEAALEFALLAMRELPRSKVSADAGRVEITAIANSPLERLEMERRLRRAAPQDIGVSIEISAPRPVITPFTLRLVMDENGVRFDACSADTEEARARILDAAFAAGLTGNGRCTLGLGVPSTTWAEAVDIAITSLAQLGAGSVTFSDADIVLEAAKGTDPALFDRVVGEMENALPQVFALRALLPEITDPKADAGPEEFVATLSPEGQVQLRGRIADAKMRDVAQSFARAKFGSDNVYMAARIVDDLPPDWPAKVLTGIEALGFLDSGAAIVSAERVAVSGRSGNADASDLVARLMADKLGDGARLDINIDYLAALDPALSIPTPESCEADIAKIVSGAKIIFEPGSATIDASALSTMDKIAAVLQGCGDIRLEVQGHTDSQGRESMNLSLSQARAESILNELRARRVLTSAFTAKGYGEDQPIASNATEEGREANRRIEFRLIRPTPSAAERKTTLETLAENGDIEAIAADNDAQPSDLTTNEQD